jgi:hypothetical protein
VSWQAAAWGLTGAKASNEAISVAGGRLGLDWGPGRAWKQLAWQAAAWGLTGAKARNEAISVAGGRLGLGWGQGEE